MLASPPEVSLPPLTVVGRVAVADPVGRAVVGAGDGIAVVVGVAVGVADGDGDEV
ncbi:hypothetical protein [Enemella dayhoffiae]|uniref:hypothetical protein n=1 Tax=Enemella dayhoffiae TaxID=2016507 RepID=UPI0015952D0C|nr:hypothetical protein [Enemella dayhoffiae]